MNVLRAVFAELVSLFVDDGILAALTLALIAVVTILMLLMPSPAIAGGGVLFFGVIAILAESVFRAARNWKR